MQFTLEQFKQNYDTEIFPVKIKGHDLRFYKPQSIDRFINPEDLMDDFPLWAKIWEASVVLTQYMADLPVDPHRRVLELGAGLGVAGISAAALGHNVTLTEHNPDALNFLRANAAINHCKNATIQKLDWFEPQLEGHFDVIIGSEIVYQERAVDALGHLFQKYLAPQGKVVLSERVRATGASFFEKMSPRYNIQAQKRILRSKEKAETVVLFKLTLK